MPKSPKNLFSCKEVYQAYAEKLLTENPEYWGKYGDKIKNKTIYKHLGKTVVTVTSYTEFRAIVDTFFTRAKHYIIEGYELNLGNNLGIIAARRVERNFSKKVINYSETAKQPRTVDNKPTKIIYHTEPDWCRIGWKKTDKIRNIRVYGFSPTPDDMHGGGFKREFKDALTANSLLRYRYQYFPYILDNEEEQK